MNTLKNLCVIGLLSVAAPAGAETATMCVSGLDQAIASGTDAGATLTFALPKGALVTGVGVEIEARHTWLGDLVIQVEHGGTFVTLIDRVNMDVFPFGCGGRDIDAIFRDDANATPADLCAPTTPDPQPEPMLAGDLRPEGALSAFNGSDPSGAWTITISDLAANDSGTLDLVCVTIEFEAPMPCTGDVDGSGAVDIDDLNMILSAFGTSVGVGAPTDLANGDGVVDIDDLNVVLANWAASC